MTLTPVSSLTPALAKIHQSALLAAARFKEAEVGLLDRLPDEGEPERVDFECENPKLSCA